MGLSFPAETTVYLFHTGVTGKLTVSLDEMKSSRCVVS